MVQLRSAWTRFLCLLAASSLISGCIPTVSVGWRPIGLTHRRSMAIPDEYPLGSVNRAHYHTMQENAEASAFILNRNYFVE